MTIETGLPPCRHRGPRQRGDAYLCHSPKLVGLPIVGAADCRGCGLRDHPVANAPAPRRRHLFPCAHLGKPVGPEHVEHLCNHPRHRRTTWSACQECPDYLFPFFTPSMPDRMVRRLITLGPRPQPDAWWTFPNVQRGYRYLAGQIGRAAASVGVPGKGRGIVIVGGGRYFVAAYVTIRVLRRLGCDLPIELWHLHGEISDRDRALLRPWQVACMDADATARQHPFRFLQGHWWKGWQLKPYAIAHSRFREVLFLDADCYPARDPSFLFRLPAYRQHRAIFWPDLRNSAVLMTPQALRVFGVEPANPPLESGQMVIDKDACARELALTLWYNAHADFVYRHIWGDKDTFNIAWNRLGRRFAMLHPEANWERHTILQYDQRGRVLFQHRCRDKFRLGDITYHGNSQVKRHNDYHPALAHEDFCFAVLDELRQRDSGVSERNHRSKSRAE